MHLLPCYEFWLILHLKNIDENAILTVQGPIKIFVLREAEV